MFLDTANLYFFELSLYKNSFNSSGFFSIYSLSLNVVIFNNFITACSKQLRYLFYNINK